MRVTCFSLACLLVILSAACGTPGSESSQSTEVAASSTRLLEFSPAIGMETGDSCYVFGDIRDACVMEDGRIVVLDAITCRISCYDPQGVFLMRTGGSGEGPGEYSRPSAMTVLSDGRIAVSDPGLSRITFLREDLSVDTIVPGFIPWSPERITPGADGSFYGSYRIFDRENSMYGRLIASWSDSPDQDREYYMRMAPFNRERLRESTEETHVVFTSDFQGNLYYIPFSYKEFKLITMGVQGDTLGVLEEEREPVPRSAIEIEEEREEVAEQLRNEGAPPDMRWNPAEYRPMVPVLGMGVDPQGRLWIRDGREEKPVFDVYLHGEHLFRVEAPGLMPDEEEIRIRVTQNGILAWSPDPVCYPAVYPLRLSE